MVQFLSYYKLLVAFADEKPHLIVAISVIIRNKKKMERGRIYCLGIP